MIGLSRSRSGVRNSELASLKIGNPNCKVPWRVRPERAIVLGLWTCGPVWSLVAHGMVWCMAWQPGGKKKKRRLMVLN